MAMTLLERVIIPSPNGILNATIIAEQGLPTDNRGPSLLVASISLSVVAFLAVAARIYGRFFIMRVIGPDDYCVVVALGCAMVITILDCLSVPLGMGGHIWYFGYLNLEIVLKYAYVVYLMYSLSLGFTRASLLLQLLRLAPTPGMRRAFWIILGFSICITAASFFSHAFICRLNPSLYWTSKDPNAEAAAGHCMQWILLQKVVGSTNIIIDFIVWLAPLKIIWQVRLPRAQKISLAAVFMFGSLVWIASIARLEYAIQMAQLLPDYSEYLDPAHIMVDIAIWTNVETHIAIICSTIPTLRPFVKRFLPSFLTTDTDGSTTRHPGTGLNSSHYHTSKMNSIPLGSIATMNADDRDNHGYSSSTEGFATIGPRTDIEAGGDNSSVEGKDGIFMSTEVSVRVDEKPQRH